LEYESETKTSIGSVLPLYISPPPPSSSSSPIDSPPPYHNMSQPDYPTIIKQLQEQVEALTTQLAGREAATTTGVTKPQVFNGTLSKVSGFYHMCRGK